MDIIITFFQKLSIRNWVWISIGVSILANLCLLGATAPMMYIFSLTLGQIANILLLGALVVYSVDDINRTKGILVTLVISFIIVIIGIIQCFTGMFSWISMFASFFDYRIPLEDLSKYYYQQSGMFHLIQNMGITIALACGIKELNRRYRWPYFFVLVTFGLITLVYILGKTETFEFEELEVFNSFAGIPMLIAMIVLLFIGGKKHEATRQKTSHSISFTDKSQMLLKLKELKDAGVLSQEEFDFEKSKIMKQ